MVSKKSILCRLCIWLVNAALPIDNWHPCFCISSLVSGMNFSSYFPSNFFYNSSKNYTICKEKGCVRNLTESHHSDTSPFPNRPSAPPRPQPTPHGRRPWHWNAPSGVKLSPRRNLTITTVHPEVPFLRLFKKPRWVIGRFFGWTGKWEVQNQGSHKSIEIS